MISILSAGIGFVVGAFCPAVGRKIKAYFVKEGNVVKAKLGVEALAAKGALEAEVEKIAPELVALVAKVKALLALL